MWHTQYSRHQPPQHASRDSHSPQVTRFPVGFAARGIPEGNWVAHCFYFIFQHYLYY